MQKSRALRLVMMVTLGLLGCSGGGGEAEVHECEPEGSCSCTEGIERETSCSCLGGSSCSVSGDSIEFQCEGNAACGLECGTNCLITCPGTTSCVVDTGDDGVVSCPGTAFCDVTCQNDCTVQMTGTASSLVYCVREALGAVCAVEGCVPTDCGDGVYACRTACPTETTE